MTIMLTARERGQLIRDAALAYLQDVAPRALCTSEVQAAFAPRDIARVYTALTKLAKAGNVLQLHELDRSWWLVSGTCAWCDGKVQRVRTEQYRVHDTWVLFAWLSCQPCSTSHHGERPSGSRLWVPDLRSAYDGPRI